MQQANINKTQQNQPHSRKVYALRLGLDLERPSKVTQVQARIRQSNRMTAKQSIVARAREISRTVVNFRLFQRVQASGFTEFTAQGCREHRLNRAQGFGPGRKARRITGHGGLRASTSRARERRANAKPCSNWPMLFPKRPLPAG